MKLTLLLISLVGLCGTPLAFSAEEDSSPAGRFYFKANAGGSWVQNLGFSDGTGSGLLKVDPGFRLDFAGGYQFTEWLAAELETGILFNNARTVSQNGGAENSLYLWQMPTMANVVFRVPPHSRWHPYIGAGIGGVYTSLETANWLTDEQSGHDSTFGYQGFAGVRCQFTPKVELGLEYRFMGTTEHSFEHLGGTRTQSVAISFSLGF